MLKINLKEIFEEPFCRNQYQAGNSYCAIGKIMKRLSGQTNIIMKGNLLSMTKEVREANTILSKIPSIEKVWRINDSLEGSPRLNHERALKLLIQEGLECGIFELDEESQALSKELLEIKEKVNV